MKTANLRDQLLAFEQGKFMDNEGKESWCFNFYDWFCKDTSLKNKATVLFKQTKKFVEALQIDTSKYYVFFKNNCPVMGPLYDDFRICNIETGEVIYTVTAKSGHSGMAEVYWRENGFEAPYATGKNFTELIRNLKDIKK